MNWSQVRTWINRDDGRWIRVDNRSLAWHQIIGGLLIAFGIVYFKMSEVFAIDPRWAGWPAIASVAIMLGLPGRKRGLPSEGSKQSDQKGRPA